MSLSPILSDALMAEYRTLFATCDISSARFTVAEIDKVVNQITANKGRYQSVGDPLSIPWYFIGAIHSMESSLNFTRHLHNGDPLTARTVHVPAGRPILGEPTFTWEESASDSLQLEQLDSVKNWSLAATLFQLERYNGWGYRVSHPTVLTPYLWSGSNHYTQGRYVADGKFDPDAVSGQIGAAVILRRMAERQIVPFNQAGDPVAGDDVEDLIATDEALVSFSETISSPAASTLQAALNQFPGIFLLVDGIPGPKTSDALKAATGHFLTGDPRGDA